MFTFTGIPTLLHASPNPILSGWNRLRCNQDRHSLEAQAHRLGELYVTRTKPGRLRGGLLPEDAALLGYWS